jgi:hypothetical protein
MRRYELSNPAQAAILWQVLFPKIKQALDAGRPLIMEIKQAPKSRDQEEKYHAMIGEIAKQAEHLGSKWDAESWKRLLVDQFMRDSGKANNRILPNLDGSGIVQLGNQTRKFTKEQASEFVEWLLAWGAEHGITYEMS